MVYITKFMAPVLLDRSPVAVASRERRHKMELHLVRNHLLREMEEIRKP